jgi:hypothetical protein
MKKSEIFSRRTSRSKLLVATAVPLSILFLTACSSPMAILSASASPSPTVTRTAQATTTPTVTAATAVPTTPDVSLRSEPMDRTCQEIISGQELYNFDPNLALIEGGIPSTAVAQGQAALGGITCVLLNLSSNAEIEVTVAKLSPQSSKQESESLRTLTGGSTYQVSTNNQGMFSTSNGLGVGQFISGQYWVSVASSTFLSGVDASAASNLAASSLS